MHDVSFYSKKAEGKKGIFWYSESRKMEGMAMNREDLDPLRRGIGNEKTRGCQMQRGERRRIFELFMSSGRGIYCELQ